MPSPCLNNADCHSHEQCRDGTCKPECQDDNECALNEKCRKNNCVLTCRVDNDCFLGHICVHNMCVFGCHVEDDCSASESCRNNTCTNACLENPCGANALCTPSNHRAQCSCGAGFVPNPTAQIACVRAPPSQCIENKGCTSGSICVDYSCQAVCRSDENCYSNERCDIHKGVCKPLCRRDDDCRSGEICSELICVAGCRSNSGCPSDKSCVNNECVDLCLSPTSCGTNALCSMIDHQKLCACPDNLVGNPLESCKHPVQACIGDSECKNGKVCYGGFCQDVCRT